VTAFVDTSAFYAALDRSDTNHERANLTWRRLIEEEFVLVTSNYVLLETEALLQGRLGIDAVRTFHGDLAPLLQIEWVNEASHRAGAEVHLTAGRGKLSLVDCVSFHVMRQGGVDVAFCFDDHFREQGFQVVP
jgi:predicted nucleic acid-binding protein